MSADVFLWMIFIGIFVMLYLLYRLLKWLDPDEGFGVGGMFFIVALLACFGIAALVDNYVEIDRPGHAIWRSK